MNLIKFFLLLTLKIKKTQSLKIWFFNGIFFFERLFFLKKEVVHGIVLEKKKRKEKEKWFLVPVIRCKIQRSPNIIHNDAVSLTLEKTLQNLTAGSRGLSPENRKKMALWSRARTVSSLFNRLLQHPNNISSASADFHRHFSTGTPLSFSFTPSF